MRSAPGPASFGVLFLAAALLATVGLVRVLWDATATPWGSPASVLVAFGAAVAAAGLALWGLRP
jgi:hypothetical protein